MKKAMVLLVLVGGFLAGCAGASAECRGSEKEPEIQCADDYDCPASMYCAQPGFLAECEDAPRCGICR